MDNSSVYPRLPPSDRPLQRGREREKKAEEEAGDTSRHRQTAATKSRAGISMTENAPRASHVDTGDVNYRHNPRGRLMQYSSPSSPPHPPPPPLLPLFTPLCHFFLFFLTLSSRSFLLFLSFPASLLFLSRRLKGPPASQRRWRGGGVVRGWSSPGPGGHRWWCWGGGSLSVWRTEGCV